MPAGKLIVISAPSGSGKTTIAREIMRRNPSLGFSVSATTRQKRSMEEDGRDYFFLTKEEFRRRVDAAEFVEWEEMYGNYYGTLHSEIVRAEQEGRNLLFDLDVKGGLSIKRAYPHALLIFIAPPDIDTLRERLINRRTEDPDTLKRRLDRVPMEMTLGEQFDHRVVNDDLATAIDAVQTLVEHYITT
jgi:guanylate kinase